MLTWLLFAKILLFPDTDPKVFISVCCPIVKMFEEDGAEGGGVGWLVGLLPKVDWPNVDNWPGIDWCGWIVGACGWKIFVLGWLFEKILLLVGGFVAGLISVFWKIPKLFWGGLGCDPKILTLSLEVFWVGGFTSGWREDGLLLFRLKIFPDGLFSNKEPEIAGFCWEEGAAVLNIEGALLDVFFLLY